MHFTNGTLPEYVTVHSSSNTLHQLEMLEVVRGQHVCLK